MCDVRAVVEKKLDTLTNGLTDVQTVTYRATVLAEKDHWFSRKLRLVVNYYLRKPAEQHSLASIFSCDEQLKK